jgi:hypothetical protein
MPEDENLTEICTLISIFQVFSPAKVIFAGVGVLLSVSILETFAWTNSNVYVPKATKEVQASQDTLVYIFERIENFFRRLESYIEVPPTLEMTDIIAKIMAEVLIILAIATKEIKQGRTSEWFMYEYVILDWTIVRKIYEKVDRKDWNRRCAQKAR